jgi:hypothetical protein
LNPQWGCFVFVIVFCLAEEFGGRKILINSAAPPQTHPKTMSDNISSEKLTGTSSGAPSSPETTKETTLRGIFTAVAAYSVVLGSFSFYFLS